MNQPPYIKFSASQIDKIGNAAIYLCERIPKLSKTKLLKLLYILDELSIKRSGIPFVNLRYKVWKFGPVSEELFIDLSSDVALLGRFVAKTNAEDHTYLHAKLSFTDDEFSDNDIQLMDDVIEKFGQMDARALISYTHRQNSPWFNTAKENSVLELLESEAINNTELLIDMGQLVMHDPRKLEIYADYIESN